MVLTVNSRAQIVVQDAASYQEVLDRSATEGTRAAIRRSNRDADDGRGPPVQ